VFFDERVEALLPLFKGIRLSLSFSDEVYSTLSFRVEDELFYHFHGILAGIFDRTLTLSSSGKTNSCTGWKEGWLGVGRPFGQAVSAVQQYVMNKVLLVEFWCGGFSSLKISFSRSGNYNVCV
jgi:aspartate/methionine/tyrosine aminotransferase